MAFVMELERRDDHLGVREGTVAGEPHDVLRRMGFQGLLETGEDVVLRPSHDAHTERRAERRDGVVARLRAGGHHELRDGQPA